MQLDHQAFDPVFDKRNFRHRASRIQPFNPDSASVSH
jgi:hypothetical protein